MLQRTDGFVENLRTLWRLSVAEMTSVVQAHSQDFGRLTRMEQLHVGQVVLDACLVIRGEQISAKLADRFAIENTVSRSGTTAVADVFSHVHFSLWADEGRAPHPSDYRAPCEL